MRSVFSAIALVATLATGPTAFAQSKPEPAPAAPAKPSLAFPIGQTFVAVSYKDQLFKDDRPTLHISAQYRGTGFSACNNWSASIRPRADQRLAVGPIALSRRACDERLMHNEKVYIFVMQTSQAWHYDGRRLTFDGPYGRIVFERAV